MFPRRSHRFVPVALLSLFLFPFAGLKAAEETATVGSIVGRVIDVETGAYVPGATISTVPATIQGLSDISGNYRLNGVPSGEYELRISDPDYNLSRITAVEVSPGQTVVLDVPLQPIADDILVMEAFTVSAEVVQNSGVGLLGARQRGIAVSDAVDADQMSRLGFGTAAAAMRAVTGASVVGGKYVYIRGLGERYSSTMVNGVEVPSADPDRRAVNMDMFPSDLIDAIVTTKTFTPDRPGNFTGGSVDMKTKEFPEQFTASISTGFTYNSRVTHHDFLSGNGNNIWAKDDGSRELPAAVGSDRIPLRFTSPRVDEQIGALTKSFSNVLTPYRREAPYGRSFGLAVGGVATLFNRNLGYAGSLSYDRSYTGYTDGVLGRYERGGKNDPQLSTLVELDDTKSEDDALIGSLANLTYQISPDHQVALNTMYTQSGNETSRRQTGLKVSGGGLNGSDIFTTRSIHYTERTLRSFQLAGKSLFPSLGDSRIDWSATTAISTQEEPDTRFFSTYERGGSEYFEASGVPRPARYFRDMQEDRDDYSLDVTVPFPVWSGRRAEFKVGGAFARTSRTFTERLFEYNSTVLLYDGNDLDFLRESQVGNVNPITGRFLPGQLYLVESTSLGNSYDGDQEITAYYGMVTLPLTDTLRFIGGVRQEDTDLEVLSRDPLRKSGVLKTRDTLPSASLVLALSDTMNLRAAATRTLARPNFREIADYTSFEFVGDFVYVGNPNLRRTTIDNYDLRWEWFPGGLDTFAISAFHKEMTDPIERGVFSVINSGELQYQNAPRGEVSGLEFEFRKEFADQDSALRGLSGGLNFTLVESSVDITPSELAAIRFYEPDASSTRELTGQSPYILNVDVSYAHPYWGTTVSAYFNVFGERLSQVSPPGTPAVFEQPAPTLDFVLHQRLGSLPWKLSLSAKNVLDSPIEETYTYLGRDYLKSSYRKGVSWSLGATYDF